MTKIQSFVSIRMLFFSVFLIGLLIPTYMVWESRGRILVEKAHLSKSDILSREEKMKWWEQSYRTHEDDGCAD
ncbi:hypothetical protein LEP1GSC133_3815 [Leptospira borgpetersenii serovar Pomona str. 200901868]|uniref:Uncharacterized protein n=1 Tax=Leptospira borgpetersenii serovar Pomona str. 200901868 TaxID=1192866 RepID=M6W5C2_LEPBO|nr:hypothetical protein LEP1GSC133_3815 [Leptospira borgpetersenii serovar Pomona str. 200901868]